jgi:hypothetical protein
VAGGLDESHKTAHTVAAAFVIMPLHLSRHLLRSISLRFKKLLADHFHEPQLFQLMKLNKDLNVAATASSVASAL